MKILFNTLLSKLFLINRFYKESIVSIIDLVSCYLALTLTLLMLTPELFLSLKIVNVYLISTLFLPIFLFLKVNKIIFRYISFVSILRINFAIFVYLVTLLIIFNDLQSYKIDFLFIILHCLIFTLLVVISRIFIKTTYEYFFDSDRHKIRALIFFNDIENFSINNYYLNNYNIVGFVDENRQNWGKKINNYDIYSNKDIYSVCKNKSIDTILIVNSNDVIIIRDFLLKHLIGLNINIKIIPDVKDLLSSKSNTENLPNVVSLNLINRNINWDKDSITNEIQNKNLLVTGAGGSIGSELCRQIILFNPSKLVCVDISEYNLFSLKNELLNYKNKNNLNIEFAFYLVSINNYHQMENIFNKNNINIVLHAAAYKHVELIENNIISAIETNIFGFKNILELSLKNKINKFLFVSTDKAVRPKSIMGYTKRFAEIYLQYLNKKNNHSTKLGVVRFGNVFGSAGSVIELFNRQIQNKLPITVTHTDATRYFMTIPEASILLIQSLCLLDEGEIFILDMGKPFKILDIAKKMIFFAGMTEKNISTPNGDIEIKIIGLKKGEKIHEELLISNKLIRSKFNDIFIEQVQYKENINIESIINNLKLLIDKNDRDSIINLLRSNVY